jgi:hypothetical protein
MDTELLHKILSEARDNAASPSTDDDIRVLMFDLGLAPKGTKPKDFYLTSHARPSAKQLRR